MAIGAHAGSTQSGQEFGQIGSACLLGHVDIDATESRLFEQRDELVRPAPIATLPVTVRKIDLRAQIAAQQKFQWVGPFANNPENHPGTSLPPPPWSRGKSPAKRQRDRSRPKGPPRTP